MHVAEGAVVVLAEDNRPVRESLTLALELEGYRVVPVADGAAALQALADQPVDMVILDVVMPGVDGLTACRRLRAAGSTLPVLMLTARTEVVDRVSGLDAGADDYVTKPFALEELLARVRALVRRAGWEEPPARLTVGPVSVDPAARRAWVGSRELTLTKTEFDLLELLARNAGLVLTHTTIYERIWGYDFGADSKNLAVYVGYLRRKLGPEASGLLHTARGVGYSLRPP